MSEGSRKREGKENQLKEFLKGDFFSNLCAKNKGMVGMNLREEICLELCFFKCMDDDFDGMVKDGFLAHTFHCLKCFQLFWFCNSVLIKFN